jgi:hypothetical protein
MVAKCDEGGLNKESVGCRKEKSKENLKTRNTGATGAVSFANKTWSSDTNRKERKCGCQINRHITNHYYLHLVRPQIWKEGGSAFVWV